MLNIFYTAIDAIRRMRGSCRVQSSICLALKTEHPYTCGKDSAAMDVVNGRASMTWHVGQCTRELGEHTLGICTVVKSLKSEQV